MEAGLSGPQAARLARAGLSQPLISRIEKGYRLPTAMRVTALCKAYRVDAQTKAALVAAAKALEASTTSSRIILQNPRRLQQRIMRIEEGSKVLRSVQTTMVIGQAQTPAYAEAITEPDFHGEKRTEAVQSRLARQELLGSGREFILLHTKGALRWHLVSPELMAEQLDHLGELSRRPNLRVGVIPWDRPRTSYARHTFHLVETVTGEQWRGLCTRAELDLQSCFSLDADCSNPARFGAVCIQTAGS